MPFDEFGEFFRQMPPGLIANLCTIGTMILALMVYFGFVKPRRAQRRLAEREAAVQERELQSVYGYPPEQDGGDLPDMDSLIAGDHPDSTPQQTVHAPEPVPSMPVTAPEPQKVAIPTRRKGEYAVRLNNGQNARAVEVISVLRDSVDDRLIVQIGETGYRTLVDLPDVKARFSEIMKELATTISEADAGYPEEVQAEAETFELIEGEESEPLDFPDLDILSETPPVHAAAPRPASTVPLPGDLPKIQQQTQVKSGGFLRPAKVEVEAMPEINIASAIQAYLQHKLWQERAFPGRMIHVHSAPSGGVMIQVDNDYFESVGEVSDVEVREYIAAAIQEWQERQ